MLLTQTLPKSAASAAIARRLLDRLVGQVDARALADARLLVSELVANAVQHVPQAGDIGLRVALRDDVLRVEVLDPGPGFRPRPRAPGDPEGSGWGLHFIARLSDRWAADVDDGARVWFELDTARHAVAAA